MKRATFAKIDEPAFIVDESLTLEEQIAKRVEELWQLRGFGCWNDTDTWLQAEREIKEWHQRGAEHNSSRSPNTQRIRDFVDTRREISPKRSSRFESMNLNEGNCGRHRKTAGISHRGALSSQRGEGQG
jgi:hypothetical protein